MNAGMMEVWECERGVLHPLLGLSEARAEEETNIVPTFPPRDWLGGSCALGCWWCHSPLQVSL